MNATALLTAARAARQAGKSSHEAISVAQAGTKRGSSAPAWSRRSTPQSPSRALSSSCARPASYKRFGQSGSSSPQGFQGFPAIPGLSNKASNSASLGGVIARLSRGKGGGKGGGGGRFTAGPVVLVILGATGTYYVVHLERVPQTGRLRFLDVSPTQERELGLQTFKQTLEEYKGKVLSPSHPHSKMVQRVATRIVQKLEESGMHAGEGTSGVGTADGVRAGSSHEDVSSVDKSALERTDWEVFVIRDDKQPNAFVLPGGKIFVFTGILPICRDEDGLATVLGHEIAHQLARHTAEKVSGFKVLMFASLALEVLGLDIGLTRAAVTLLLSLPNSRKMENEADEIGLQLMSKACFDPEEAQHLWERMSASEDKSRGSSIGKAVESVLSTHPVSSSRIENMKKWLPAAKEIREESGCPAPGAVGAFQSLTGAYSRPRAERSRQQPRSYPGAPPTPQAQSESDPYGIAVLKG